MSRRFLTLLHCCFFSIVGHASAIAPAAPTDGSVRFTRMSLTGLVNTQESYHIVWRDNSTDEEGFEIQMRPGPTGTFNTMARFGSNSDESRPMEAIISRGALPIGTQVQFKVVAWKMNNTVTESSSLTIPFTTPANVQSDMAPPSAVTAVVDPSSDGRINLNWQDNSDGEAFFNVILQLGTAPNFTYSHVGFVPFGATSFALTNNTRTPFSDAEFARPILVPGTTYSAVLRAAKRNNLSELNNPALVTNWSISAPFTIPALRGPTNLTGSITGESSVRLNWNDNSNNETGYEVQFRIITSGTPPEFQTFTELAENTTSASLAIGLFATAEFRVCAVSRFTPSGATTDTVIRSAFTPVTVQLSTNTFPPPTGVVATTSGISNAVDLVWEDKSTTEVGFDVLCRATGTSGNYLRCVSVPNNVTKTSVKSFTSSSDTLGVPVFTDLTIGNSYDFIVRAIGANETVPSANSNVSAATPQHGFTSRMYQPISQGLAFSHTVTTSNSTQRTGITATGLPPPLVIDSATGAITGTPSQAGRFPVTLTATFNSGPPAVSTLMLRVQSAAAAPTVAIAIPNVTIGINRPFYIPLADKFNDVDSETAVRWETTKGNIDFLLYPSLAPLAVANFMAYVNGGDYENVFFHRHVANFVLQAGGFAAVTSVTSVEGRPSPLNESGISNLPWTIAAAKVGSRNPTRDDSFGYIGNPDSATTDIFVNLNDNASNLDNQNGGFTVYGRVAGDPIVTVAGNLEIGSVSQKTVKKIRALPIGSYEIPVNGRLTDFSNLPIDAPGPDAPNSPTFAQLVKINRAFPIPTLSHTVDNQSPNVASVVVENNQLKVTGLTAGTRNVTVTATDLDNNPISQTFTVTVVDGFLAPRIIKQPVSQTITATTNTTATFSVEALGSGLSYQWRRNEVPITTATSATLTLTHPTSGLTTANSSAATPGSYDVIVSNSNSSQTSAKATLTIRSPITITRQPIHQATMPGTTVTLSVAATGTGLSYRWRRNDIDLNPPQTGASLIIPNFQAVNEGAYDVVISNAAATATNTTVTSAKATVNLRSRAAITGTLPSRLVEVGSLLEIQATVTGAPLPVCVWRRGTTIVKGQTGSKLLIPAAQLSDGGSYTVTASNIAGASTPSSGATASVIVIDKSTRLQVAKPGTTVKLVAPITGPDLTYIWSKGSTVIDESTPRHSGMRDATLTITEANITTDSGDYTCAIEAPSLTQPAVTGIIRFVVADKPVLLPMTGNNAPPNAYAGVPYDGFTIPHDTATSKTPASFTITGLPKGLTFNAITGRITGIAEAVGLFTVTAKATNPSGISNTVTGSLRVLPMIQGSTGSFVAEVAPSQILNLNHGGRLSLTVSDASTYSASLQMGAEVFKSAGTLRFVGEGTTTGLPIFRSIISFPRLKRSPLSLDLYVTGVSGDVAGIISDGTSSAEVSGYRLVWNHQFNPGPVTAATLFVDQPPIGKFSYRLNVALNPELDRTDTPQGSGYVALTIDNSGLATIAGRLADDTPVTASTFIKADRLMYWFQMLNNNKASLGGYLSFGTQTNPSSTSFATKPERAAGDLRWFKEAQPTADRRYKNGFASTQLTALGTPYVAPGTNQTVLGVADVPGNLKIDLSRGGLASAIGETGRLNFDNTATLPSNTPSKITLKITPSTGSFTGTFDVPGTVLRKATISGLIIQALPNQARFGLSHLAPGGAGYFSLPGLAPSVSTSPILSGKVELGTPWTVNFTTQPQSRSAATGTNVTLTTAAVSTGSGMTVKYQWRKDNIDIPEGDGFTGTKTASLTITGLISSDAGSYTCVASAGPLEAISNAAALTVTTTP